jgi:hypothetical protein
MGVEVREMSSPAGVATTVFAMTPTTAQQSTIVPVTDTADDAPAPSLLPAEQIALAVYEDLRAFVRATKLDLPAAFGAPPQYAGDADLFVRLLSADIERLWLHQLLTGLAFVVSAPPAVPHAPQPVLYRAFYRLQPVETQEGERPPRPIQRAQGTPDPALGDIPGMRASLVVAWTRDPAAGRARLAPPRYIFSWALAEPAYFDEQALAPANRFDTARHGVVGLRALRLATEAGHEETLLP